MVIPESLLHRACWDGVTERLVLVDNVGTSILRSHTRRTAASRCGRRLLRGAGARARGIAAPFSCTGGGKMNTCLGGCDCEGVRPHVCRLPSAALQKEEVWRLRLHAAHDCAEEDTNRASRGCGGDAGLGCGCPNLLLPTGMASGHCRAGLLRAALTRAWDGRRNTLCAYSSGGGGDGREGVGDVLQPWPGLGTGRSETDRLPI